MGCWFSLWMSVSWPVNWASGHWTKTLMWELLNLNTVPARVALSVFWWLNTSYEFFYKFPRYRQWKSSENIQQTQHIHPQAFILLDMFKAILPLFRKRWWQTRIQNRKWGLIRAFKHVCYCLINLYIVQCREDQSTSLGNDRCLTDDLFTVKMQLYLNLWSCFWRMGVFVKRANIYWFSNWC